MEWKVLFSMKNENRKQGIGYGTRNLSNRLMITCALGTMVFVMYRQERYPDQIGLTTPTETTLICKNIHLFSILHSLPEILFPEARKTYSC